MEEENEQHRNDVSQNEGSSSTELEDEFHQGEEERDERKEVEKLAQHETTRLWIWKAVLLVIILVAAALVTAGTYRFLSDEEKDDFEVSYELFANTVQDGLEFHLQNLKLATTSMANAITGAASAEDQEFPFVVLTDFEVLGQTTRKQSGIETFYYCPFVGLDQFDEWTKFSHEHAYRWINESRATVLASSEGGVTTADYDDDEIRKKIQGRDDPNRTNYAPIWQMSPPPFSNFVVNRDIMPQMRTKRIPAIEITRNTMGIFGHIHNTQYLSRGVIRAEAHEAFHESLVDWQKEGTNSTFEHPHSVSFIPVFKHVNDPTSDIVGILRAAVAWDYYLVGLLPDGASGITAVLENNCNQSYTYDLNGNSAFYRGDEDMHEAEYDHMKKVIPFYDFEDPVAAAELDTHCMYTFSLYPTKSFEDKHRTTLPMILAIVVGAAFFFMVAAFFMYDWFVQRRNRTVVSAAARATGIVSSMFPEQIRDQLLDQKEKEQQKKKEQHKKAADPFSVKYLTSSTVDTLTSSAEEAASTKAIADFFPETTVMFADIVGFTAWSSVREPCKVFELLETLYAAFDDIAKQRRIFKVETVGDCYVAVAGLPEPRKDHAVAMARFAKDCLLRMQGLLKSLEVTLGPDTGDLSMRFGLNSGPVTAGVLRGQRSRFQLFGDTMNTAARMESTGRANMIQLSQETADLLKAAGKGSWLTPREEMTAVKGKGLMVTFWLNVSSRDGTASTTGSSHGISSSDGSVGEDTSNQKHDDPLRSVKPSVKEQEGKNARLVQWNVEIVSNILRQILSQQEKNSVTAPAVLESSDHGEGTVLDEVQETIKMPSFSGQPCPDAKSIELGGEVVNQLHDFISTVASMYRDNPFHNFEHASHVTMATVKLLSRVVNPKIEGMTAKCDDSASALHDFTYGITSDPLTQLACVFSAIIHDVDHPGVPNSQLLKEKCRLAAVYKRSIAEQNSFDLAWNLFMDNRFMEFRQAACAGEAELRRFRQLVINLVMATDILDKELNGFRNQRWEKAFGTKADIEEAQKDKVDRKATIVIEHLIQASDVAHTMQHWHIYRKWNGRLFTELYAAYLTGRSDKDPSTNWYAGEMGFFDFYIIPLAKKLAECGVFGVASSEYLDYATRNRREWESRGREVVAEMLESAKAQYGQMIGRAMSPMAEEESDIPTQ